MVRRAQHGYSAWFTWTGQEEWVGQYVRTEAGGSVCIPTRQPRKMENEPRQNRFSSATHSLLLSASLSSVSPSTYGNVKSTCRIDAVQMRPLLRPRLRYAMTDFPHPVGEVWLAHDCLLERS